MNNLNIAYAALLHDIGKFYQRTTKISLLNSQEIASTPIHANGYHTHIHSGYTAKFFHDYLHLNDQLEKASSGHHINEVDEFDSIIRDADRIASKIDRNDENFDFEENHKKTRYQYITSRLSSIMGNIDFGQTIYDSKFKLTSIDQCMNPCRNNIEQNTIESIEEYKKLFAQFIEEIKFDNLLIGKPTPYKYHRMYSLLYKYTTLIPSSTYETNNQTVSLFDHLKLTTAIASCLSQNNCNNFYMLEFDVSGIQSFIYKITEGSKTKTNIAKSLRGRSAFVTLITNAITYTILDKFKLTQANIIFNTGGGALLLLPYLDDTEKIIHNTFNTITKELYKRFNTSLSVVYAIEKVDKFELSNFKTEKALALKTKLEEYKLKKFYPLINNDFCVEHLEDKEICELCGQNYVKKDHKCQNCLDILNISDYYTKHDKFTILYSNLDYNNCLMDLGFIKIYFFEKIPHELINKNDFYYIDAVNHFEAGNVKLLANLVPKENNTILNFENITKTLDKSYGDEKLGVLKMDVDNLGAIFAFGLKQGKNNDVTLQRSLSKYLTLSRFIELFFGYKLKQICLDLSKKLQNKNENIFYINYAGGDDLVILGPIYGILQLANKIHIEFKEFVQNPNITLSAGIHIQNPKKPIRFGIKMADNALEASKSYVKDNRSKNAITIMNSTFSFEELPNISNKIETYRGYLNDKTNPLSRTGFYNIMSHMDNKTLDEYYSTIPIIQYSLYRQIDNSHETLRKKILQDLTTLKTDEEINKQVTIMKLVILFTREVN